MNPFRRVLIALDGTEKDSTIIRNMALMSRFMAIHKIYFVHILIEQYIPNSIREKYPEVQITGNNDIKDSLNNQIMNFFPDINKYNHDLIIKDGDRTETIIEFIKDKDIDFLAMGRRPIPGVSYLARKIGHLAPCSMCFFPILIKEKFNRVVVPIDFSEMSLEGLKRAYFYQNNDPEIEVYPVHLFNVPPGFYKTGKSYDEFSSIMRTNAETNFKKVLDEIDYSPPNPSYDVLQNKNGNTINKIFNYVLSKNADLIIIGARGQTQFASFMLGNVAMKLLELIYHIPFLIEKDKKSNSGIFDFLSSVN